MKKIILLNILFFLLLMCIFLVAAFAMGTAGTRFGTDAGILFLLIITIHLFLNYMLMHRRQFAGKQILYASVAIACVYLLILFH